ncbi:MAG: 2-isopropylmalate synthase [Sandaracinaceae bacterium]|nr:2-isopropylmalate synthase [Sandaracinaceae bacterium]
MTSVIVFDTTLRDGEQSPGASMTPAEKLQIARALSRLRVDVIEAGFPAASPDDLSAVQAIAREVGNDGDAPPIICALARAHENDLRAAFEAVRDAARPRIHTFLATSPIHRQLKLGMSREEVIQKVAEAVARAKELTDDVEFSAEDACRTEPGFLCEVFTAAVRAGATTLNVPDTVGYVTPLEMDRRIRTVRANVAGIEDVTLSVHCHDDLGMATANTLAGVAAGARQVEVTINGVGERAGNTALEEVVMALHTRSVFFGGLDTRIDTTQLHRTSRLVSTLSGMPVQPNKAVVGANAFAHEAGIHQDGMLKARQTYEIMRPETIGRPESELVMGKHSGRHALKVRLAELGHPIDDDALDETFARFKALADRKKHVTNADLVALVAAREGETSGVFRMTGLDIKCGTGGASAEVRLVDPRERAQIYTASGGGPVDACFRAIDRIVGVSPRLLEYRVHAVTEGIDALGEVSVRICGADHDPKTHPQWGESTRAREFHGYGADTDIIVASAHAYVSALNRMLAVEPVMTRAKAS